MRTMKNPSLSLALAVTIAVSSLAAALPASADDSAPVPTTVTSTPSDTPGAASDTTKPVEAVAARPAVSTTTSTARVTAIVDGDTVRTSRGTVRLIGVDTPERGRCGYSAATSNARRLAPVGSWVKLTRVAGRDNQDRYGRYLRYVSRNSVDLGGAQIKAGLADARYDSRDGYGWHPNQDSYVAQDIANPDKYADTACATATPTRKPAKATSGGKYTGCRAYGRYGTSRDSKGRRYTKIDCRTKRPLSR